MLLQARQRRTLTDLWIKFHWIGTVVSVIIYIYASKRMQCCQTSDTVENNIHIITYNKFSCTHGTSETQVLFLHYDGLIRPDADCTYQYQEELKAMIEN